jgi:hypothetical protein
MTSGGAASLVTALLREPPDLAALATPETWNLVKAAAPSLGVATHIAHAARPHVSGPERAWCDRVLLRSWQNHDQSLAELESVLAILDEAGIPAISLKGPLLARRHYQPYFLRKPSSDIDIAVGNKDLEAARDAFIRAGYTAPIETIREARAQGRHVVFSHPSRRQIELHFRLSHGHLGIPVEEFFDRAVTVRTPSGRSALMLEPADELMHLILHFAHRHKPSHFLPALHEVRHVWMSAPAARRQDALNRAAAHRFAGAVAITDLACQSVWGCPLLGPDVRAPRTWLHRWVDEKLYRDFERHSAIPSARLTPAARLRGRWLEFRLTDTPFDTLRVLKLVTLSFWFWAARNGAARADRTAHRLSR